MAQDLPQGLLRRHRGQVPPRCRPRYWRHGAGYLATRTTIGRKVALKVLLRSLAQREDVKRSSYARLSTRRVCGNK